MKRRSRQSTPTPTAAAAVRPLVPIARDRHGRGIRGRLAPAGTPMERSRADGFDDLVRDAVQAIPAEVASRVAQVEFAVEDVPSLDDWPHDWVPAGRAFAANGALPARIVLYRRPVETRARGRHQVRAALGDLLTEQIADLLGTSPDEIDPGYGRGVPDDDQD